MKIGVLSGKGGTGKTTVAVNLALSLGYDYVDCDVEEPNGFLFLGGERKETIPVNVSVPKIDKDKCILCGECVKNCNFNALAYVGKSILDFPQLCHSCGACYIVCKHGGISEIKKHVGNINRGKDMGINIMEGILNIGEPMATPIIKEMEKYIGPNAIIDCAPGTTCTVVETIRNLDYCILVTESTLFGLHDLKIAVNLVRNMKVPFKVIINKWQNNNLIEDYCESEKIHILEKIPLDKNIASLYARGELLVHRDEYKNIFENIKNNLVEGY